MNTNFHTSKTLRFEWLQNQQWRFSGLCDVSSLKHATELEVMINIKDCDIMESLLSSSWSCWASSPLPSSGMISGLNRFACYGWNLEEIKVYCCDKMEDIIATWDEEGIMGEESSCCSITKFSLPKLRILRWGYLPELESICSAKLICDSLQHIKASNISSVAWQ
jgi:disease resistance protein RPS2